ncbi:hypothetical protein XA68_13619 [Ophiocordyceps unilateralis]|uniref:RING-type E3 ubiquitin transferase n=1 Tax=Ophiocordyceps unilateralis TaxID=268505 RepID=A0A2A9PC28_OPHUN|nr:hypothetical protein XA68_13619 [Ophiocordyceps unilateralis]
MTTPPSPSGPILTGGPETVDEQHGSHSSAGSGSSSAGQPSCPWRTRRYHYDECSRYFDCPTHTLERDLSTESSGQVNTPRSGLRSTLSTDSVGSTGDEPFRTMLESPIAEPSRHIDQARPLPIRTSSLATESRGSPSRSPRPQPRDAFPFPNTQSPRGRESGPFSSPFDQQRQLTTRRQGGPGTHRSRPSEDGTSQSGAQGTPLSRTQGTQIPRWQPDAEVTYCPICNAQFSIFVRKHHCRKCGRVVCNSCSPHRIIIPHQYIVRAPGSDVPTSTSLLLDGLGAGYFESSGPSGGERVRLCNPCVPDPNTAPPQSPASSTGASSPSHHRSRSSVYGVGHGAVFTAGRSGDGYQYYSPRWRSVTMGPTPHGGSAGASGHHGRIGATYHTPLDRLLAVGPSAMAAPSRRHRHSSFGDATSSRHRALPPPPQIAEEDECPICHRELPSRGLPDFETLRESHISMCIQAHSTYGSPRGGSGDAAPQPPPRRTGMYTYAATEKDCIDDAECTICLEEFAVGVPMARLECLCRFHRACISAWFVNHPGRCPVHQHDGFGF